MTVSVGPRMFLFLKLMKNLTKADSITKIYLKININKAINKIQLNSNQTESIHLLNYMWESFHSKKLQINKLKEFMGMTGSRF